MKTILFQGDSITDAGRSRTEGYTDIFIGNGYPTLVASKIAEKYPMQYKCLNRGVACNRSVDMYARIKQDTINLAPDYLTILIGVNDVWQNISDLGLDADKTEIIYDLFVTQVEESLPNTKIILLEPFVFDGAATHDHYDEFRREIDLRRELTKRIAEKHKISFVPLQDKLQEAIDKTSADYIMRDGVHPLLPGHNIIANELFKELEKIL